MPDLEFKNRTVLVTGGSRGIGRARCERLAQAGAKVAVNYHSAREEALETVKRVEASGVQGIAVQADVTDPVAVEHMLQEIGDQLGPIDMLVNNAGIFEYVTHEEASLEHWRRTLDVNLTSMYIVTWAVKEQMIQRQYGRIVNMASISAMRPRPYGIAYAVSKAGIIAFTQSTADALISDNIRINAVAPGLIDTEIIQDVDPPTLNRIVEQTPMRRIGQVEEIAELVHFLLSDASSFMMGQTLVASGGRVMLP